MDAGRYFNQLPALTSSCNSLLCLAEDKDGNKGGVSFSVSSSDWSEWTGAVQQHSHTVLFSICITPTDSLESAAPVRLSQQLCSLFLLGGDLNTCPVSAVYLQDS